MPRPKVKAKLNPYYSNTVADAKYTVGAEATNVINVAVQLKNGNYQNPTVRNVLTVFISGASTGADVVGTAPTGGAAIGTNGKVLASPVANKVFIIQTDAQGRFDLNLTDTGTPTFYLVAVLPDGSQVVSSAITFA